MSCLNERVETYLNGKQVWPTWTHVTSERAVSEGPGDVRLHAPTVSYVVTRVIMVLASVCNLIKASQIEAYSFFIRVVIKEIRCPQNVHIILHSVIKQFQMKL